MMNLQELARLLNQLGIKSEFIACDSDNYHTRLGKIRKEWFSFQADGYRVSTSNYIDSEVIRELSEIIDFDNECLRCSLESAKAYLAKKADWQFWGCEVGNTIHFDRRSYHLPHINYPKWGIITELEKGNNPPYTCKYHAYTDKGEFVSWHYRDYIAFRVRQ